MAYYPRVRARRMWARIRGWPEIESSQSQMLAHVGFKAGCVQIVSIDDREHVPNRGKQLVTLGTVIVTPPVTVLGVRGYSKDAYGMHAEFDVMADDVPKKISKYTEIRGGTPLDVARKMLPRITEIFALIAVSPRAAGLEQKKPYMFESPIRCGSVESQFAFGVERLGKEIKFSDVFQTGATVDVGAITKGKGWQGVIQRMGVKRKQHKSRKTVREVGSLGPISPQNVMYTVPRAGQMGFHQRVEYSKRIMIIGNTEEGAVGPPGGFKHFGDVKGDYIIVKGSVPGTYRRMIKIRSPIRNIPAKVLKPNILEVVA
jgi:large subunit ribosomal protein L3